MTIARLEHLGISVTDLDFAVQWYSDYFGAEEVRRFEKADFEIKAATLRLGDGHLEIIEPLQPSPAPAAGKWPVELFRPTGVHHLAVAVPDIADLHERMKGDDTELLTDLIDGRFFFCRDPFGTLIEVRQQK